MTGRAPRIVVIGAGLAGLAAADALRRAGLAPVVLEKSRGIGGRLATRRTREGLAFDHGAPVAPARPGPFAAFLRAAEAAGDAAPWGAGAVGVPGMSALPRGLADGLDIRFSTEATELARDGDAFGARLADGGSLGADAVLVTAPAPQAARLCAAFPALAAAAAAARMTPCWTLMAAFGERLAALDSLAGDGPIRTAWRQGTRPGRAPAPERWVAHADADWTTERLELEREAALPELLAGFVALSGGAPTPAYAAAHRWRYARVAAPVGAPCVAEGRVVAAGDWLLGAEAGDAFASGRAAADAILDAL